MVQATRPNHPTMHELKIKGLFYKGNSQAKDIDILMGGWEEHRYPDCPTFPITPGIGFKPLLKGLRRGEVCEKATPGVGG